MHLQSKYVLALSLSLSSGNNNLIQVAWWKIKHKVILLKWISNFYYTFVMHAYSTKYFWTSSGLHVKLLKVRRNLWMCLGKSTDHFMRRVCFLLSICWHVWWSQSFLADVIASSLSRYTRAIYWQHFLLKHDQS